jgi:hypothetical protein
MTRNEALAQRDATIVELWQADLNSRQIAVALGVTRNVVIGVVDRARKRGEIPLYRENSLVPENLRETHARMVTAKLAARRKREAEEAEAMAKLAPPEPLTPEAPVQPSMSAEPEIETEDEPEVSTAIHKPLQSLISFFDPDPPDLGGVSIAHVKSNQCRSILPDIKHRGMAVFCGRPTKSLTSSWCEKHHRLYYSRVPPKRDGFVILTKRRQEA